jgi:hypothetical protein
VKTIKLEIFYPPLDKAISDGNIEYLFSKILPSDENLIKSPYGYRKTDLEDVISICISSK